MCKDIKGLSALEYKVLFEKATEPPFSHPFNTLTQAGIFACKNCDTPLFCSENKYDSDSGWPSFYDEIKDAILCRTDYDHKMMRTEIMCAHCQGHLGHVFPDGPEPTGLRYCVNGVALSFKKISNKTQQRPLHNAITSCAIFV